MATELCIEHGDRTASFHCARCRLAWCTGCADHHWTGSGFVDRCRRCQEPLEPLTVLRRAAPAAPQANVEAGAMAYLQRVPHLARFVATRSALVTLLGLTALTAPLSWLVDKNVFPFIGAIVTLMIVGFEITVYFGMVTATAYGKEEFDFNDIVDIQNSIFSPIFRYLAAALPVIIGLVWLAWELGSLFLVFSLGETLQPADLMSHLAGPGLIVLIGLLLLPLLTIIAAVSSSLLDVLNPALWIRTLRVLGGAYLAAAAMFYVVLAVEKIVLLPLLLELQAEYSIPVITSLVVTFLAYVPMALRARLLGGLIEPYFNDLR